MVKIQTCKQPDSQSFKNVFSHLLFVALKIVSLPPGLKNVINFHYGPPSPSYKSTCSGDTFLKQKSSVKCWMLRWRISWVCYLLFLIPLSIFLLNEKLLYDKYFHSLLRELSINNFKAPLYFPNAFIFWHILFQSTPAKAFCQQKYGWINFSSFM